MEVEICLQCPSLVTSFTLMKWLKFVLAARNIDGWLKNVYCWLEFVMVLAGLTAQSCACRVYSTTQAVQLKNLQLQ